MALRSRLWLSSCLPGDGAVCSYRPIVDYIDAQFENYLQEELKIRRSLFDYHDTRIHVCLYFITPTGHSLKSLDLVTMKKLDSKVCAPHPILWLLLPCGMGCGSCSSAVCWVLRDVVRGLHTAAWLGSLHVMSCSGP